MLEPLPIDEGDVGAEVDSEHPMASEASEATTTSANEKRELFISGATTANSRPQGLKGEMRKEIAPDTGGRHFQVPYG